MTKTEFNTQVIGQTNELKSFAKRFTKDHEEINDLLQETFLKAVTYFNSFQEGTNLRGWLYTIMRNTFINNYRRMSKGQSFITTEEEISPANLYFSAVHNAGENKFMMEDIQSALKELEEGCYIPFTMYFEGYKYNEIAEYLDLPIGTVKTRIHIARKKLKHILASYKN
ncbi:RNA polymerase sigma factor [Sphingobacterium sp. SYP-B4668]|uniref:RNA polymerase sigma factor n=1 Tax=Sphingobacterium sp. SYP-B4668 TaxID=2996035 RepID=UPI0022DD4B88|nr:sigma-70 family RNA polymerase sigma factor [Sphingobacterium sp. SYP-B4668]